MSFTDFKEVTIANPGSSTRYGSDDVLDVMKILNGKTVANRRPLIANRWRWTAYQELKQMTEASVPTPSEADVVHLFQSATDNHIKVKKTGGTIVDLENIGSGTWSNTSVETFSNKTINIDTSTVKHSTTNATGDIVRYDAGSGKYARLAKGTANQVLAVNAAGTDLEWQVPAAGGGGGGETNTASNVGSAGIGLFHQKLGVDLQFKQLFSPDGSVNISDDTGNQKVDLTLPTGVAKTGTANTYGDFQQTFRSSRLAITNPANTFAYFWVGSAIAGSRNVTLPLLTANDQMTCDTFPTNLLNKNLGNGTVASTDVITLKHSTTNTAGELLRNTGTKFDRFAKGVANTYLKVNASGTDLEWGSVDLAIGTLDEVSDVTITSPVAKQVLQHNGLEWVNVAMPINDLSDVAVATPTTGQILRYDGAQWVNAIETAQSVAGVKLPDGSIAPTTGRWGAFFGGSGNGMGMMGFNHTYSRLHGTANSATESVTSIYTAATTNAIAEFKTGCGFRRDSSCVFKAKWQLESSAGGKVKIGLSNATSLPAGGAGGLGPSNTRYDVTQNSSGHLEMDNTLTRHGVRFDSGASGLNEVVTEVLVRFRKNGTPSGTATVGIRKNSDGTLVTLGTFTPNSFGSGEQVATITPVSPTYQMLVNDRVVVEYSGTASDGIELDQDDNGPPSGYTCQQWTGSWTTISEGIGFRIRSAPMVGGGGTSGDTPLASASGIMVHGTIGTHTNYRIARNNGATLQTDEDSTKPLATTSPHTLEININATNCVVTLDGTAFTYTTTIPATTIPMAWFMHLETATAVERGLGIIYAQVVMTS